MGSSYDFLSTKIYFTPLVSENVYGTTVDVTQDVDLTDFIKSISTIRREVDNGDNDFGIFTFGNINLTAINYTGKFNDEHHNGVSIFPYKRDRTKVEIKFQNKDGTLETRFKGLLNDDATRQNLRDDTVSFKILSLDSIFRQVRVAPGSVVTGDLFSLAIKKILNVPDITTTLNYNAANITVDLDLTIDEGEAFSNSVAKDRLDQLLLASNSILYVDKTDTVYVKPREESATQYDLNGRADKYGRDEIIDIRSYNTGLQRAFSSIKVNDNTIATAEDWVDTYGFRQKTMSFDFINTPSKELQIAQRILDEFKAPKQEMEVDVKTDSVNDAELLNTASVNYPHMLFPANNEATLPMIGVAQIDSALLPIQQGSFEILPNIKWKIIAIDENPRDFITTIKLRQAGKEWVEGYFA